jgi:AcrR family transcriptional regulator
MHPSKAPVVTSIADLGDGPEPAWRQRVIERSTQSDRQRAAKRVQRFFDAAREIIDERGTIEFTVQEVVDRSSQSLRSFYGYFDGKHDLLLALFEEEMAIAARSMVAASLDGDPLERLRSAVITLYEMGRAGTDSVQPLFFEFAERLFLNHPDEVLRAMAPVFECLASIVEDVADAGLLRRGRTRRQAMMVLQMATLTSSRIEVTSPGQSITSEEMWDFCLHAIVPDHVIASVVRKEKAAPADGSELTVVG